MALSDFHFFSPILGKQVAATIILPEVGTPPFAALYLLHGLSDDHTIWHRQTRLEAYAQPYPLAIVMPDGFRGFYTNNESGPRYADYFMNDVVGTTERHFNFKRSRDARSIGGLSMGGYGALRLGLGFADEFASIHSHSGALRWGTDRVADTIHAAIFPDSDAVFGVSPQGSEHDLLALVKRCGNQQNLPKIRIDCGTEDFLLDENRRFSADLIKLNVPHEYAEYPGGHDWGYWDQHVQSALQFHAKSLGLSG